MVAAAGDSQGRVPIRFGRLKPLFAILGLTGRWCHLDLGPDVVGVRMGWAFRTALRRRSIVALAPGANVLSIGVHGWRGRWIVNGAAGPIVALTVDPVARGRLVGWPVRVRELRVSVDDPAALIAMLAQTESGSPDPKEHA